MQISKKIRNKLSNLFPLGKTKEYLKLFYYNLFIGIGVKFSIKSSGNSLVFKTKIHDFSIFTNEALYFVARDFFYYQNFYKIKSGDFVIDAGANVGALSIYFSKVVGLNGKVYSFEPDSLNINSFTRNLDLNKNICSNIVLSELLLWNSNELVPFAESGTVASSAVWLPDNIEIKKKQATTLDSWIEVNKIEKIDFIKMDIEGAEIEALDGCLKTIQKFKPNFAIASYHEVNHEKTFIKVEAFFTKLNYPYKTIRFKENEIITFAGTFQK
jgi:FkbM family methyltransferase